jgi:hypothetical protein
MFSCTDARSLLLIFLNRLPILASGSRVLEGLRLILEAILAVFLPQS